MFSPSNIRAVLRFGGAMLVIGAFVSFGLAFLPFGGGPHAPVAVPAGTAVTLRASATSSSRWPDRPPTRPSRSTWPTTAGRRCRRCSS